MVSNFISKFLGKQDLINKEWVILKEFLLSASNSRGGNFLNLEPLANLFSELSLVI